ATGRPAWPGRSRGGSACWSTTTGTCWPTGWSRSGSTVSVPREQGCSPLAERGGCLPGWLEKGDGMRVVHLTASTFFGGPERQMLGLARHLAPAYRSAFLSFSEGGRCEAFVASARQQGYGARALAQATPRLRAALKELRGELARLGAGVLCCHGYKADVLGRLAARRLGIPVVAVSRGWTAETWKVRLYEALDRI